MTPLLPTPPAPVATAAQRDTARAFEAVFVGQVLQLMLQGVETGEFGGGHGEEMFRGVMAEQMGTEIARRGGVGIAPAVLQQILKIQAEGHS